jgi:hypothetical protein
VKIFCCKHRIRKVSLQYDFSYEPLSGLTEQLGNLLSLCREIAGARDILQKFENLKKQREWNFNL